MKSIKISMLEHEIIVSLRDNKTAKAIWDACPIESRAEKWGDEIYFKTPVIVDKELEPLISLRKTNSERNFSIGKKASLYDLIE